MDFQRRGYFWEVSRKQLATMSMLILLVFPVFCQKLPATEGPPVKTYDSHSYYEEDGLASNIVYDMVQATDGLLWFITQKGISTFDGFRWETFREAEGGPPETSRLKLLPTAEGGMLAFGSFSLDQLFLRYYLNGKWQQLPLPANGEATYNKMRLSKVSMTEYAPNRFYVSFIHKNFIYLFDSATKKWKQFVLPQEIGDWEDISEISFFQNHLYLLLNKGLAVFDLRSGIFDTKAFPELRNKQLLNSAISPDGKGLYVLGDNFVGRVCEGEYKELISGIYPHSPQFNGYSSLLADRNNRLFFNHNAALFKFNTRKGRLDPIKVDKPKSSAIPTKIFEDREGNIWFCSMRGVSKISSFKFHTIKQESGLVSDEISTIFPLDSTSLLLGGNTGFSILEEDEIFNTPIAPSNYNASLSRILQAVKTPANQIYLAAASLGLGRLRSDKSVEWFPHPENKIINTVAYHQGKILVGTADGYIFTFINGRYEVYWQERIDLYVRKIIPTGDGLILLTGGGVYKLEGDNSILINGSDVRIGNIYSYFPWNGRIFLGSMEGLCELRNNKIEKVTEAGLRIDRPVYALLKDKEGRLWAGTDKGVFVHDKGHFVNFHTAHGLAGKEVNRHAFELMANGEIWIGTDQGISVYQPEDDIEKEILPTVRVTEIELPNGKNFLQEGDLTLESNENTLAFNFQTISFHLPSEISYRYKLEGIDEHWIYSDNHLLNSVRYTKLPPGGYRFVVQARSSDGMWSSAARSLPITIKAPFYTSWWFILLLLGLIVSAGYAMHAFVMNKRNAKQLQLAIEEKKKEIEKSERRFKAIWDATDTGIALLNKGGKILMANPAMCSILQTQKEAVAGTSIYHLLSTPLFSESSISKMYDLKKVVRKTIAIKLDKKTVHLIITINFVDHLMPGESLMVVGCKDITDQKHTEANNVRLNEELLRQNMSLLKKEEELANYNHELLQQREELEQALKAVEERNFELDQFVYKTSHDLRAPIASAMGLLNVIQLENDHSRLPKYLELIGSSLEKQDTFIKAMLSFSKSTRVKNKAEGVDIKQLIEQCLQDLQHLPGFKEISIEIDISPVKEPFNSDKMKLYIILANIISNSIKYRNPHIKNVISIKSEPTETGIRLRVEDNGIGIASEIQPAIFEMFYRGTELSDGSGLGLYIVKQTVEKLRGTISVTSKAGAGSCFTVIIPNQQEPQSPKSIKIKTVYPLKKS